MDYRFFPMLLIRSPSRSYTGFHPDNLEYVLLEEEFQYAISLASKDLYEALAAKRFQWSSLPDRLKVSVFNYYNRMSFRPTPFGAFASVSTLAWSDVIEPLVRSVPFTLLSFPDFSKGIYPPANAGYKTQLSVNPTIYLAGDQLRYIYRQSNPSKRDSFRIMKIPKTVALMKLLRRLETPADFASASGYISKVLELPGSVTLLGNLIRSQVLLQGEQKRITGSFLPGAHKGNLVTDESYSLGFHKQLGTLNTAHQHTIKDALWALKKLRLGYREAHLSEFRDKFLARFEGQQVPLLRSLDPQLGVSYLGTETGTTGRAGHSVHSDKQTNGSINITWNQVNAMLLQKIQRAGSGVNNQVILSEADLKELFEPEDNAVIPPSLSVLFRLLPEDKIMIEQVGGSSALNIAGRFSHDINILDGLRKIANLEQSTNPDVIFAEVSSVDGHHADNISSRGHLRDYEIPVLTFSDLPKARQIHLNDLYISIVGEQVILRSKSLNKRIVPRLGSAYNYNLSNLPVFRFLTDLQAQGLIADFSFDPEYYLPGLSVYPRITFKNAILSAAKWIFTEVQIRAYTNVDSGLLAFRKAATELGISKCFVLVRADQHLTYQVDCDSSLRYFLHSIKRLKKVVIQEFFLPGEQCLQDQNGNRYISQIVTFMVNQQATYSDSRSQLKVGSSVLEKTKVSSKDWLYFKIYGHPETIKMLLRDPTLDRLISSGKVEKWFFVIYSDPGYHFRLRVKLQEEFGCKLLAKINEWVRPYLNSGMVSDFLAGTYLPEYHRYGFAGMDLVESIFFESSRIVLHFYQKKRTYNQMVYFAIGTCMQVVSVIYPEAGERNCFLSDIVTLKTGTKEERVGLDEYFRANRSEIAGAGFDFSEIILKDFTDCLLAALPIKSSPNQSRFSQLVSDLLHMHINRINIGLEPKFEFSIYYLLLKLDRAETAKLMSGIK